MKKLFLALIVFGVAVASQAQGVRIGAKLGANLNKVTGKSFNEEFDLSYHAGGFLEIDINKKWGLQPEVYFNQATATRSSDFSTIYTGSNPNANTDIKLNYLSIPILLRYNVGNMLTLNAGPQFSILMNNDKTLLQNGSSAFKSGDFAMAAGAQLNLKMLRIYGRYNIGLSNINDIDDRDQWKSQQLQLGLGVRL
jgi:hypothetical protein